MCTYFDWKTNHLKVIISSPDIIKCDQIMKEMRFERMGVKKSYMENSKYKEREKEGTFFFFMNKRDGRRKIWNKVLKLSPITK